MNDVIKTKSKHYAVLKTKHEFMISLITLAQLL